MDLFGYIGGNADVRIIFFGSLVSKKTASHSIPGIMFLFLIVYIYEFREETRNINETVEYSRKKEIQRIKEQLIEGKNVLITGLFIVGKTSLAKHIMRIVEKGEIWPDENRKTFYFSLINFSDWDEEEKDKIKKTGAKLVVIDEIGNVARIGGDEEDFERFVSLVKEINEQGSLVIAVGKLDNQAAERLRYLFGYSIELALPEGISRENKEDYIDANRL